MNKLKSIVYQSFVKSETGGIRAVSSHISNSANLSGGYTWFDKGQECEILRAGSSVLNRLGKHIDRHKKEK